MSQRVSPQGASQDAPFHSYEDDAALLGGAIIAGLGLAITLSLAFTLIALGVGRGWFQALDTQVLHGAYELRTQSSLLLDPLMHAGTHVGSVPGLTIQALLIGGWLLWQRPSRWRASMLILTATLLGVGLLNASLKELFERPRPELFATPYMLETYSFPSGHAMSATAFYGGITAILLQSLKRARRAWALILACASWTMVVAVSRLYFSVHYATDILAGIAAGMAWLVAIALLWDRLQRRKLAADA